MSDADRTRTQTTRADVTAARERRVVAEAELVRVRVVLAALRDLVELIAREHTADDSRATDAVRRYLNPTTVGVETRRSQLSYLTDPLIETEDGSRTDALSAASSDLTDGAVATLVTDLTVFVEGSGPWTAVIDQFESIPKTTAAYEDVVAVFERIEEAARRHHRERIAELNGQVGDDGDATSGVVASYLADAGEDSARRLDGQPIALLPIRLETRFVDPSMDDDLDESELRIRVYPDQVHLDAHEPELTDREVELGERFWAHVWYAHHPVERGLRLGPASVYWDEKLPTDDLKELVASIDADAFPSDPAGIHDAIKERAWAQLVERFGRERAAWIVHRLMPDGGERMLAGPLNAIDDDVDEMEWDTFWNSPHRGAFPTLQFPPVDRRPDTWSRRPSARALPDRWVAYAYPENADEPITVEGNAIREPLPLGPDADADSSSVDGVLPGLEWMVDFDEAVDAGMAFRIRESMLSDTALDDGFSKLVVVGVKSSMSASDSTDELRELLDAHHYTHGLSLLEPGTPTNNYDADSGYSSGGAPADSLPVECGGPLVAPDGLADGANLTDGNLLARALGVHPEADESHVFAHVENADMTHQRHARHANSVLWPATLGYSLKHVLVPNKWGPYDSIWPGGDTLPSDADGRLDALERSLGLVGSYRRHFIRYVRAGGPLPAFRAGKQPYGVLPADSITPPPDVEWDIGDAWRDRLRGRDTPVGELLDQGVPVVELVGEVPLETLLAGGVDPRDLYANGVPAPELFDYGVGLTEMGATPTELLDEGIPETILVEGGFAPTTLLAAGVSAEALVQGEYTAATLREAGVPDETLVTGDYGVGELRAAGVPDRTLMQAGFGATDLREAGVPDQTLLIGEYDAGELRRAGVPDRTLIGGGFSAGELRAAGVPDRTLMQGEFSAADLREAGVPDRTLMQGGYDPAELKAAGFTDRQLLEVGYDAEQLQEAEALESVDFSADELRGSGYSAGVLRTAGFSASKLRRADYGAGDLRAAGYAVTELRDAGFSARELRMAGIPDHQLLGAGFDASELKDAGLSDRQLVKAGFSASELRDAGVSDRYLIDAGFSAQTLRDAGVSDRTLVEGGFSAANLHEAGVSDRLLLTAGFTAAELKAAGFTDRRLASAGFTASELKAAGFTDGQLIDAGFDASELKAAGFTDDQLLRANFSARELKAAGVSDQKLVRGDFDPSELRAAGVPASRLADAGFDVNALRTAGYTDAELRAQGVIEVRRPTYGFGFGSRSATPPIQDPKPTDEVRYDFSMDPVVPTRKRRSRRRRSRWLPDGGSTATFPSFDARLDQNLLDLLDGFRGFWDESAAMVPALDDSFTQGEFIELLGMEATTNAYLKRQFLADVDFFDALAPLDIAGDNPWWNHDWRYGTLGELRADQVDDIRTTLGDGLDGLDPRVAWLLWENLQTERVERPFVDAEIHLYLQVLSEVTDWRYIRWLGIPIDFEKLPFGPDDFPGNARSAWAELADGDFTGGSDDGPSIMDIDLDLDYSVGGIYGRDTGDANDSGTSTDGGTSDVADIVTDDDRIDWTAVTRTEGLGLPYMTGLSTILHFREHYDGRHPVLPKSLFRAIVRFGTEHAFLTAALRYEVTRGNYVDLEPDPATIETDATNSFYEQLDPSRVEDALTAEVSDSVDPRLSEYGDSLRYLAESDLTPAEIERLFTDALDLASHRLDAWGTSIATKRLFELRDTQFSGDSSGGPGVHTHIGGYGYVEDLHPDASPIEGEYLHAPSLQQADVGAVLRAGHRANEASVVGDTLAVDISPDRVRKAMRVLDGVRQGQSLGVLLGYRFERGLHELELEAYIHDFRRLAPGISDEQESERASSASPGDAAAKSDVVDGYELFKRWETNDIPFGRDGLPPQSAVRELFEELEDLLDAVGDLLTAESVYQFTRGKFEQAGGSLDALARGEVLPEVEVVHTPRSGVGATHRLLVLFGHPDSASTPSTWDVETSVTNRALSSGSDGDPTVEESTVPLQVRPDAEPNLNAWIGSLLPEPSRVRCLGAYRWTESDDTTEESTEHVVETEIGLDDLALSPLDVAYLTKEDDQSGQSELEIHLAYVLLRQRPAPSAPENTADVAIPPDATVELQLTETPADTDVISFADFLEVVRSLREFILDGRAADARDLTHPGELPDTGHVDPNRPGPANFSALDLAERADDARARLTDVHEALDTQVEFLDAEGEDEHESVCTQVDTVDERLDEFADAVSLDRIQQVASSLRVGDLLSDLRTLRDALPAGPTDPDEIDEAFVVERAADQRIAGETYAADPDADVIVLPRPDQRIRIKTRLPQGMRVSVRIRSAGDRPFMRIERATVGRDGDVTVRSDFDDFELGTTFRVEIPRANVSATGQVAFDTANERLTVRAWNAGPGTHFVKTTTVRASRQGRFDAAFDFSDVTPGTRFDVVAVHDSTVVFSSTGRVHGDGPPDAEELLSGMSALRALLWLSTAVEHLPVESDPMVIADPSMFTGPRRPIDIHGFRFGSTGGSGSPDDRPTRPDGGSAAADGDDGTSQPSVGERFQTAIDDTDWLAVKRERALMSVDDMLLDQADLDTVDALTQLDGTDLRSLAEAIHDVVSVLDHVGVLGLLATGRYTDDPAALGVWLHPEVAPAVRARLTSFLTNPAAVNAETSPELLRYSAAFATYVDEFDDPLVSAERLEELLDTQPGSIMDLNRSVDEPHLFLQSLGEFMFHPDALVATTEPGDVVDRTRDVLDVVDDRFPGRATLPTSASLASVLREYLGNLHSFLTALEADSAVPAPETAMAEFESTYGGEDGSLDDLRERAESERTRVGAAADAGALGRTFRKGVLEVLRAALLRAAYFGVYNSIPVSAAGDSPDDERRLATQAASVAAKVADRLDRDETATPAQGDPATVETGRDRLSALFGESFAVLPTFTPPNADELAATFGNRDRLLREAGPLPTETWLQRIARVRDRPAAFRETLTYAEALTGRPLRHLEVGQLPYAADDDWIGIDGIVPQGGHVSLVGQTTTGFESDLGSRPIAGLYVDEWVETVPSETETTGVAINYDNPGARAPQSVLLAVPPESGTWTTDAVETVVADTMELAKLRTVDLGTLAPELGHLLPALTFAYNTNPYPDTPSIDFDLLEEYESLNGLRSLGLVYDVYTGLWEAEDWQVVLSNVWTDGSTEEGI